jgi:hypothetical protein
MIYQQCYSIIRVVPCAKREILEPICMYVIRKLLINYEMYEHHEIFQSNQSYNTARKEKIYIGIHR